MAPWLRHSIVEAVGRPTSTRSGEAYRCAVNQNTDQTGNATPVCEAVVEAVADAEGIGAVELTPPLYDAIDTEALDTLFTGIGSKGQLTGYVTFSYNGYDITVSGEDDVSIENAR